MLAASSSGSSSTLRAVQELADEAAQKRGALMCFPNVHPPTRQAGDQFLMGALREERVDEDALGWALLHVRAHVEDADVLVPVCVILAAHALVSTLHWWVAVALLPGTLMGGSFVGFAVGLQRNPFAATPARQLQRNNVVTVGLLLLVGAALFVRVLAPAMWATHARLCALEALAFGTNAWCFYKTIYTPPGFVPLPCPGDPPPQPGDKVCSTCGCVRPLRSKHDPFIGRCVQRFDHFCPLVINAVGEQNQGYFVLFALTMLLGQLCFIRLCLAFLAAQGEGVLDVLLHRPGAGWARHPVVMLNLLTQAGFTAFNLMLCSRALYGICAELTANEMANARRYAYLWDADSGEYDNPFDRGVLANTWRFFASLRGAPPTDWDAMAKEARAPAPLLSVATCFKHARRVAARMGWVLSARGGRGGDGSAHGHSHGGVPCHGHGHGHGHAHAHGIDAAAAAAEEGAHAISRGCTHGHGDSCEAKQPVAAAPAGPRDE